ncbi:exonuclease domain-containing protein [Lysinibacter sp. HNR]|uniref:exonuclease domain-containing protein n=1 Tax=Lysinibacter sp. HNR TaxID=3031408 RepID=UPI002434B1CC|nr:exonuclease domain-containing protein [Lysinibacter sp. HNR]WGD36204.1 exonuclease domain-containing protein [Lysinibacter sp. HNR]
MTENSVPLWCQNLAVFDTETTGINTSEARVVTATLAVLDAQGAVTERHDWFINPGVEIPERATSVHGVTTAQAVAGGMDAATGIGQILDRIRELFLRGLPLVIYNAPYDLDVIRYEALRYGIEPLAAPAPVLDPLIIDKAVDRYRKGKRTLEAACMHYGVVLGSAHDAGEDAIASGRVMQQIAARYVSKIPEDLEEIHRSQVVWAQEQAENFQEYMRRRNPQFVADGAWPERL